VIGSLISSLYASRISDSVTELPDGARTAAEDSIGKANAVAEKLPADQAANLTHAAASAFTDAMAIGFTVAGVVAVCAAVAVKLWLPARHLPQPVVVVDELSEAERLAA
jgi:ABC-type nitrate/sulfonate/bicarbonate transport system permease component